MNTYGIGSVRSLRNLSNHDLEQCYTEALSALRSDLLICIRADINTDDVVNILTMTHQEYADYYRSGGIWGYRNPQAIIDNISYIKARGV